MARKTVKTLEKWEVAIVKAMLDKKFVPQDVHAYFSRPSRSINQARISQIKDKKLYAAVKPASDDELDAFLEAWPDIDPATGLHLRGDELLVKAREAMIAAVSTFNGAGLHFRAELFIVTSVIAWTYLLHAFYKREGVDYRHKKAGVVQKTKEGADKYWELGQCLAHDQNPFGKGVIDNLSFLIEIRHEIEHRSTDRIDDALSAKLQACCINFNDAIKTLFGKEYALEKRLPIALQFATFDPSQRSALKRASKLPANIESSIDSFEGTLTDEEYGDPAYRYRVAFVPIVKQRESAADAAIKFFKAGSDEANAVNEVHLKEVDKTRHTATQVVRLVQEGGYPNFGITDHTRLWKSLDAKREATPYGKQGDYKQSWVWFDNWIDRVREHCAEHGDRFT